MWLLDLFDIVCNAIFDLTDKDESTGKERFRYVVRRSLLIALIVALVAFFVAVVVVIALIATS